jgi:hypothetical protein
MLSCVWQRYDALTTDGDTSSSSSARVSTLLISALTPGYLTSHPAMGVPASNSQSHLYSHHGVVEMVATAASATVSNVVRVISTEAVLSVQTAEMKVQWCVSPTNIHSADELPTFYLPFIFSVSIGQLDKGHKADAPLMLEAYEYLVSSTSCVIFHAKFWNLL